MPRCVIMLKKFLAVLPLLLLTGCATTFTRLTPLEQPRNSNNLYPVEVVFNSSQQSLRWESIQPYVLVNGALYPMRQVPMMQNRWDGFVPVPPGTNSVKLPFQIRLSLQRFRHAAQAQQRLFAGVQADRH